VFGILAFIADLGYISLRILIRMVRYVLMEENWVFKQVFEITANSKIQIIIDIDREGDHYRRIVSIPPTSN